MKGAFWTRKVPAKGPREGAVKSCCGIFEDSGYAGSEVKTKTDQEEVIIALRTTTAAARIGDTGPTNSAVRGSKANGRMEEAVRIW